MLSFKSLGLLASRYDLKQRSGSLVDTGKHRGFFFHPLCDKFAKQSLPDKERGCVIMVQESKYKVNF